MGGGRAEGGTARADANFDRDRVGAAQLGLEPTYSDGGDDELENEAMEMRTRSRIG